MLSPDHKIHAGYARVEEYDAIGQESEGLVEGVKSARLKDVNIDIPGGGRCTIQTIGHDSYHACTQQWRDQMQHMSLLCARLTFLPRCELICSHPHVASSLDIRKRM